MTAIRFENRPRLSAFTRQSAVIPLIIWLRIALLTAALFAFWRALYIIVYPSYFSSFTPRELTLSMLVGLRFDISTTLATVTAPLLLLYIPLRSRLRRFSIPIITLITIISVCLAAGFVWGDLLFFGESGHHITSEPFDSLHDSGSMFQMIIWHNPFSLLTLLILWSAVVLSVRLQFRPAYNPDVRHSPWWGYGISLLMVVSLSMIGIRGGLQKEPLRSADAIITGNYSVGNLALNGWYTFLSSVFSGHRIRTVDISSSDAIDITRRIVSGKSDRFLSEEYPLWRNSSDGKSIAVNGEQINVVLMIIESLNASYLRSFGGKQTVMPFLDSLAGESLLLTNCSAISTRSMRGLCALLLSFPNLTEDPFSLIVRMPNIRGAGDFFADAGYQVRFMHAAAPGSMGISAVARMAGYREFLSSADFPAKHSDKSWGIWDSIALERLSDELQSLPEPYHYGIFTLSTHHPWSLPPGFKPVFPSDYPDAEILNTFAYVDDALKRFFERETNSGRASRTLYVIVGDHTTHATESERFRVACLFYAPGRIESRPDDRLTNQLDILPTILELAGLTASTSAFGRSVLSNDSAGGFAVTISAGRIGWRRGNRTFISQIDADIGLFDTDKSVNGSGSLLAVEPFVADSLRQELYAFYRAAQDLMITNRIYPPVGQ